MEEKIIKHCCKYCVEKDVNCLGCAIASNAAPDVRFEDFCKQCIEKSECVIDFKNVKDRNVCWVLSDEDKERYRKDNPAFDTKLKVQEKEAEEKQADAIHDAEAERMEKMLELRKKRLADKKAKEGHY